MTEVALTIGATLLAFGPFLSLFALVVYKKAQLVIVVTSAAFFFLLGATASSFCWWVFHSIGLQGPFSAIIPGVFFQFIFRCLFVALYHKVEAGIRDAMERQHIKHQTEHASESEPGTDQTVDPPRHDREHYLEVARLRLALNDASCGVAAGVGYGGMHAILLYGTLLASETNNVGVLYQQSCPAVPSLVVSALFAFFFSILDVFWMLFTFFGMRRRLVFHRGDAADADRGVGAWFGNSRSGGNLALLLALFTHLITSVFTISDFFAYGCLVSLPVVATMVLVTAYLYWAGMGRIYMPPGFRPPLVSDLDGEGEGDPYHNN